MKYIDQVNPVNLNLKDHDYYREGAVVGRANPELPIGSRMLYSFKVRRRLRSPGVSGCEAIYVAIL